MIFINLTKCILQLLIQINNYFIKKLTKSLKYLLGFFQDHRSPTLK